jgi:mono/diheme cytochrome c family protein
MTASTMLLLMSLATADSSGAAPAGERLVERYCSNCHPLETVYAQKRSEDEWTEIIYRMMDLGLNAEPEELEAIRSYLAKNPEPTSSTQKP